MLHKGAGLVPEMDLCTGKAEFLYRYIQTDKFTIKFDFWKQPMEMEADSGEGGCVREHRVDCCLFSEPSLFI